MYCISKPVLINTWTYTRTKSVYFRKKLLLSIFWCRDNMLQREQRPGEWQWELVCLLTGGGRHLGPALLPGRWQGSSPTVCACVYVCVHWCFTAHRTKATLQLQKSYRPYFCQCASNWELFMCIYGTKGWNCCLASPAQRKLSFYHNSVPRTESKFCSNLHLFFGNDCIICVTENHRSVVLSQC